MHVAVTGHPTAGLDDVLDEMALAEVGASIVDFLLETSGSRSPRTALAIAAVERVRALLDAEPATPHSAAELERATGLDRWTLARQFRAAFGTRPEPHDAHVHARLRGVARTMGRSRRDGAMSRTGSKRDPRKASASHDAPTWNVRRRARLSKLLDLMGWSALVLTRMWWCSRERRIIHADFHDRH